jgi:hypothetical protein
MRRSLFPLTLTFFGLTLEIAPQFRVNLFTQIHEIVFHGQGGYDWETVYNMPIWLRKFTFHKIQEYYNKQKEDSESMNNGNIKTLIDSSGKVQAPEFAKKTKSASYK